MEKQSTTQTEEKKGKFIWEETVLHRSQQMIFDRILFCINTNTFLLFCVQIQFKGPSRQVGILSSNILINMRSNL